MSQEGPAVKVGDLVRYQYAVRGMNGLMGLIVATNGEGFDVRWIQQRKGNLQTTTEVSWFLEVIPECQTK